MARRGVRAIGDLHGEAPAFLRYLLGTGLLVADGDTANWAAEAPVLVQTGDIPDRGPDTIYLAEMIREWRAHGATIYTLLGNHDLPYLLSDDQNVTWQRMNQAVPYMVDQHGDESWAMPDVAAEYRRQAEAITALHDHPDGGLVALRLGEVLFQHGEPHPLAYSELDLAALADDGMVRYAPERHPLTHPLLWARPFSFGTADSEGGYRPARQPAIPGSISYEEAVLALHAAEPGYQYLYSRLKEIGIKVIVHGHVPAATVRGYEFLGLRHYNIDEAICRHYRQILGGFGEDPYVPQGWQARRDLRVE